MKKLALQTLALFILPIGIANAADIENWCGTYTEEEGRAYIRLARADFGIGSDNCITDKYNKRVEQSGSANIGLNFTHNASTVNKWRKFQNHLIEVRGKYHNGIIDNVRLVRDIGI